MFAIIAWIPWASAQGSRTTLIAPADLWVRAELDVDWGDPILLTTCVGMGQVHESVQELPVNEDGSKTLIRHFSVSCPCEEIKLEERQYIHILPATPLPEAVSTSCSPIFNAVPETVEVAFGTPDITVLEALISESNAFKVTETRHLLWQNECGLGAHWVVWEAMGPCGEVERRTFTLQVVSQHPSFADLSLDLSHEVDLSDFDADDFGVGPLGSNQALWQGLHPVEVYRTLGGNGAQGASGPIAFQRVAIGCGGIDQGMAGVGTETVSVTGNIEPWLGFQNHVDIDCGLPLEDWPLVRARDREVGHFGAGLEQFAIPYDQIADTLPGECSGNFTILRHISATDADGAEVHGTQTLHVTDTSAPDFYGSPEELVWSGESWPPMGPTAQALDGCDGQVDLTWADSTDCASGRIIRVNTATDGCGNRSTLRQIILPQNFEEPLVLAVGCNDPNALNFTGDACFQTSQCLYTENSACLGDLDENGFVSTNDLLILLGIFGTFCQAP